MKRIFLLVVAAIIGMQLQLAAAAPPQTMSYSGYLTNASGAPITATVNMTFSLFTVTSGGTALWGESQSLAVSNGQFNAVLGTGTLIAGVPLGGLVFNAPYYLEVTAGAETLSPRVALTSSPYAFRAVSLENGAAVAASQVDLTGNLVLVPSTAGAGNILKGANRFIHNFGTGNTFIGESSGNFAMSGQNNTGSGFAALASNTSGNENTANGSYALAANTTGFQNTATGTFALESNTTGSQNTATGVDALEHNITGTLNTASGVQALFSNFGGNNNTAAGAFALKSNFFGSKNTATGALALQNNTSGNVNTANGWNALGSNTTGFRNTAIGESAMFGNTTGTDNTAAGISALAVNTTGIGNTASGATALLFNKTGNNNTANGSSALYSNVIGNSNIAIGNGSLYNAGKSVTAGSFVTGAAYTIQSSGDTDYTLIGAANNNVGTVFVATGAGAGTGVVAGNSSSNIAIGQNAGGNLATGNNNIVIGTGFASSDESGSIRIGDASVALRTYIAGILGANVSGGVAVLIGSGGQLGTASSSRRYKDDIANMDAASNGLMALRPVTFHYKADQSISGPALQYGLIAEEVAEVYPGLVTRSANGQIETVMYQFLPPMLLNEWQKQQRTLVAQATELARQRTRMEALEGELQYIKSLLGAR